MPKELHDKLQRTAKKKGFSGKKLKRYVFGALHNLGYGSKPKSTSKLKSLLLKRRLGNG